VWARLSLRTKLTLLVIVVVSLASFSFGRVAASGLINLMEKATGQGAVTAALSLSATIDSAWLLESKAEDSRDPIRVRLQALVDRILSHGYVHRVTVLRYAGQDEVEYVLNLPADGSDDYNEPGSKERVPSGTPYLVTPSGYETVRLNTAGAFLAGWVPIEANGRQVGVVIVIVDGNEVQHAINTINVALAAVLAVLILLAGMVAYKFAASFEKTAVTDGLMNIYNHKYLKQRLEQEVAKSHRYGQQTSLVLLDIDFFKRVNDTYGHATGDLVLKQLARIVTDTSRNTDVVARYGGEEVAVILTHTGVAGAQEFAERLRLRVSEHIVRDPEEDAEFRVTVSIGVAQCEKGVSMMDLIRRADAALYHSKGTGRNRVTIYQEDILMPPEEAQTKPKVR
jgi:diguanylate cyclase (GGDEF)-like protein